MRAQYRETRESVNGRATYSLDEQRKDIDNDGLFDRILFSARSPFEEEVLMRLLVALLMCGLFVAMVAPRRVDAATQFRTDVAPSGFRLLMHTTQVIDENMQLRLHVIPSGNLARSVAPMAFLGVAFLNLGAFAVEPVLGYHFTDDEPIMSFRLSGESGLGWVWTDVEWRPGDESGYAFFQGEYRFLTWLNAGAECEGFGKVDTESTWTIACGPNGLWMINPGTELDVTIRLVRTPAPSAVQDSLVQPQGFVRFHLKFR